jgi:hypothetical protein
LSRFPARSKSKYTPGSHSLTLSCIHPHNYNASTHGTHIPLSPLITLIPPNIHSLAHLPYSHTHDPPSSHALNFSTHLLLTRTTTTSIHLLHIYIPASYVSTRRKYTLSAAIYLNASHAVFHPSSNT